MNLIYRRVHNALKHVEVLHEVFSNEANFSAEEKLDAQIYKENEEQLRQNLNELNFDEQLYGPNKRQMILADFLEYIFLGRGYYSISKNKKKAKADKGNFIRVILHFVNLLMGYETITASSHLRRKVLERFGDEIAEIKGNPPIQR
jgi:FPC/CPF motif-containing protein YcgG